MISHTGIIVASAAVALLLCNAALAATPVTRSEELNWIRYTVPLPKEIKIAGKVELSVGTVAIEKPMQQHLLVDHAAAELAEIAGECSGAPAFTVRLVLGGDMAEPLKPLKNSGQACRIVPVGSNRLEIIALEPHGIYYGVKTLQQLIKARKSSSNIEMPLLAMTDWPDLAERGLWGSDNFKHLK